MGDGTGRGAHRAEERVGQRSRQQTAERTGTHEQDSLDQTLASTLATPETPRRSDEGLTNPAYAGADRRLARFRGQRRPGNQGSTCPVVMRQFRGQSAVV